jgi:hypothetical protein
MIPLPGPGPVGGGADQEQRTITLAPMRHGLGYRMYRLRYRMYRQVGFAGTLCMESHHTRSVRDLETDFSDANRELFVKIQCKPTPWFVAVSEASHHNAHAIRRIK